MTQDPLTLVDYSSEGLCRACRELPPVEDLKHYEYMLHETFESFLACSCRFCAWLQEAQKADLSSEDWAWVKKENAAIGLLGNLFITPQTLHFGNEMSGRANMMLHLFTNPLDPCANFILGRDPFEDPRSDQSFKTIEGYINECLHKHEQCSSIVNTPLPSYIVDISRGCRLVKTDGAQEGQYAALSYVWGVALQEQPVYLSVANEKELLIGIPEGKLPQTIKDAVFVTRKLRIRYLWIDALCIVQDDDVVKKAEIARMHQIFGDAFLTIQASRAKSIKEGFLQRRPGPELPHQKLRYHKAGHQNPGFVYVRATKTSHQEGPVGTRAWCFEEGVLSKRVLQYAKEKIFYECLAGRRSDDGARNKKGSYTSSGPGFFSPKPWHGGIPLTAAKQKDDPRLDVLRAWYSALDNFYTPRFLTKKRDRLLAIAGVAHRIRDQVGGDFLAGLWQSDMLWGLLWSCRRNLGIKFFNSDIAREWKQKWGPDVFMVRPEGDARAPSWSWAALDGPTYHWSSRRWTGRHWPVAEILQYPKVKDETGCGELSDDRLVVSAHIQEVYVVMDKGRSWELYQKIDRDLRVAAHSVLIRRDGEMAFGLGNFDMEKDLPQSVQCVFILNTMGLMVVPSSGDDGIFRRVGVFFLVSTVDTEKKVKVCIQ